MTGIHLLCPGDKDHFLGSAMLIEFLILLPAWMVKDHLNVSLGHKTKICPSLEVIPEVVVTDIFKTYHIK